MMRPPESWARRRSKSCAVRDCAGRAMVLGNRPGWAWSVSDGFASLHPVEECLGLRQYRIPAILVHPVPCAIHLRHARVTLEPVAVAVEEVPVEQVERTGALPRLLVNGIGAGAAVIR